MSHQLNEKKGRNSMSPNSMKKNLRISGMAGAISILFFCLAIHPVFGSSSFSLTKDASSLTCSETTSEGDIPTWYPGDQWVYKVEPLSFSSSNGSFYGKIDNFRQLVVGRTNDVYEISITGTISGDIDVEGFSGELTGQISGTSSIRVSDLAEITTTLHSEGEILVVWIPFPYEMDLFTSSTPPLELYDFPLFVGEEWQLACLSTISGSFSIQGVYEQPFDGNQWIDETVQCTQQTQVTVPAGTFDCYEIGRPEAQAWFSTDAGNVVKSSVDQSDENMSVHIVLALQSFSRAAQPITISEEITPSMAAPGVPVMISGQAVYTSSGAPVQNGAVSIQIPCAAENWDTTTNSNGYYTYMIESPSMTDDTASGRETGSGGVLVQCIGESLSGYRLQTLTTVQDTAPATPSIEGPTKGKKGVSYDYSFVSVDAEDDDVFYFVDWGDGTNSSWVGPFDSGEEQILSHTFTKKGSYTIQVKARDVFYAESDWRTLEVSMPKNAAYLSWVFSQRFPLLYSLLERFLRW